MKDINRCKCKTKEGKRCSMPASTIIGHNHNFCTRFHQNCQHIYDENLPSKIILNQKHNITDDKDFLNDSFNEEQFSISNKDLNTNSSSDEEYKKSYDNSSNNSEENKNSSSNEDNDISNEKYKKSNLSDSEETSNNYSDIIDIKNEVKSSNKKEISIPDEDDETSTDYSDIVNDYNDIPDEYYKELLDEVESSSDDNI